MAEYNSCCSNQSFSGLITSPFQVYQIIQKQLISCAFSKYHNHFPTQVTHPTNRRPNAQQKSPNLQTEKPNAFRNHPTDKQTNPMPDRSHPPNKQTIPMTNKSHPTEKQTNPVLNIILKKHTNPMPNITC